MVRPVAKLSSSFLIPLVLGCATVTQDPDYLGSELDDSAEKTLNSSLDDELDGSGGAGASLGTGGALVGAASGGSPSGSTGGSPSTGGGSSTGGSSSTGGTSATGGTTSSGGSSATGGASATDGSGGGAVAPSCSDPVLSDKSTAKCGDLLSFGGKIYVCISQASGVNGETTGCGSGSVYCSNTAPDHNPYGPTAWAETSCD